MSKRLGGLRVAIFGIAFLSAAALAGEGGSSHILPGSTATLVDLPPATPGTFFKPMYFNYDGTASGLTPKAAGIDLLPARVTKASRRFPAKRLMMSQ
jgi:hypothetical protein